MKMMNTTNGPAKASVKRLLGCLTTLGVLASGIVFLPESFMISSATAAAVPQEAATISIESVDGGVGEFLTSSDKRSLYVFELDAPGKIACKGPCLEAWPPFVISGNQKLSSKGNVDGSLLGTLKRDDGTLQVTYKGMPLYFYALDRGPGEAKGQGVRDFGGQWSLIQPTGEWLQGTPSIAPANTVPPTTPSAPATVQGSYLDGSIDSNLDNSEMNSDSYGYGSYGCGYYSCYSSGYCCDSCGSCYYGGGYGGYGGYSSYYYPYYHHRHHHHGHHGGHHRR